MFLLTKAKKSSYNLITITREVFDLTMKEMKELSKKIIDLRIATRKACMCEDASKALLGLKTKILFIISKKEKTAPFEIISELKINKANLALITKQMESEQLISRKRDVLDRREINYAITPKGNEYLEQRLQSIESSLKGIFENKDEYSRVISSIDEILHMLSFLSIK